MAVAPCDCGYANLANGARYTDAIIVYFNETEAFPEEVLAVQTYADPYEQNWNARYREGAVSANVAIGNATTDVPGGTTQSLELYVDPPLADHLVVGGGIQSVRRDIQYGTFRSSMRSPGPWTGGSALSMFVQYNDTQSFSINLQNTDDPSTAWISTLLHNEFPSRSYGVNYTYLLESAVVNGSASPWSFMDVRVDWNKTGLDYYVNQNLSRSVDVEEDGPVPTTPAPLTFRHGSNGDPYATQGPPINRTLANVAWIRAFFNSSLMDQEAHAAYDVRCRTVTVCDVEDMTLRGSTPHQPAATLVWEQNVPQSSFRWPALGILLCCFCFTALVIFNAFFRRVWSVKPPKNKQIELKTLNTTEASLRTFDVDAKLRQRVLYYSQGAMSRNDSFDSLESATASRSMSNRSSAAQTLALATSRSGPSPSTFPASTLDGVDTKVASIATANRLRASREGRNKAISVIGDDPHESESASEKLREYSREDRKLYTTPDELLASKAPATCNVSTVLEPTPLPIIAPANKRIDYLAGLLAFCAVLVSMIHYCLTFIPALVDPGAQVHYSAEKWVAKTISPYLLNYTWVGLFLAISTRFLVERYLRNGDLENIALKTVGRVPRLMIPVTIVVLLEYLFLDVSATKWLEYLPSITYSTWPYVVVFPNFGQFIDEILELAYLTPNAVPRITFNYCIGVLWTIPVQIQGSWQALLGALVVRELKSPEKKFAYYAFCIVMAWYARNWASIFLFGLMLTDLDVRHHYRKWLHARPFVYYPFIAFLVIATIGGLTMDATNEWDNVTSIAILENGWHPDQATGLPIAQTTSAGEYPEYYAPKLSGLVVAFGALTLVELSPFVQRLLTFKALTWIFPHIFTMYLIHGFIFWSLGSMLVVFFATRGLPYWAIMLLNAVICYTVLALALVLLSPVVESLGIEGAKNLWRLATETSPPWRKTLFPFPPDVLDGKRCAPASSSPTDISGTSSITEFKTGFVVKAVDDRREKEDARILYEERRDSALVQSNVRWVERRARKSLA